MTTKIGIYLRISDEDCDKGESNSIEGQRKLLHAYINKSDTLAGQEILEFSDDGFSGTNFERPAVQEMLQKVQIGEIRCILVKDISRFGRNYIEVGTYIEQVFPSLGVRFISVNDSFDSMNMGGTNVFIGTAFQTLVYDLYSRDLSQKIISGRRISAEQGKFVTAFAPYGYCKNNEGRLSFDAETAYVVRRIFDLAVLGVAKTKIGETLNQEGIPSPLGLRKQRSEGFFSSAQGKRYQWQASTVDRILKDRRYVGEAIYGKTKRKKIGGTMEEKVPQGEWIVVPNAHKAIVPLDTFERANATRKTYKYRGKMEDGFLQKMIYCGGCKRRMTGKIVRAKNGETTRIYYGCRTKGSFHSCNCFSGKIEEKYIGNVVIQIFRQLCLLEKESDSEVARATAAVLQKKQLEESLVQQNRMEKHLKLRLLRLYKKYKSHELNQEIFLVEQQGIQSLRIQNKEKSREEEKKLEQVLALERENTQGEPILSSSLAEVENCLERVEIGKGRTITLKLKLADAFLRKG